MSIVLEGLTKRYDGHPVVNHVSLEIADGEFFVLLGPSGSGKSTVLRMIAGLASVDGGRVLLHGRDVTALQPQQRDIGFVFQHYALFPHMTVAQNIEFGLHVRKMPVTQRRQRRDELLDLVGLAGLSERLPRQLSGGQQQRVALARALAIKPQVLLLDEPFGALDARIRTELRANLRRVQRELGVSTIFVTHDQEEAFELADRLGVMNNGRLLEAGPPDELYLRPQTEFAATFLGTANLLLGESTATGVRVGDLHFPLRTEPQPSSGVRRVQVLFRPEDVALAPTADALSDPPLGQGTVEHHTFVGAYERLRLSLPPLRGVREISPQAPFGSEATIIEATRTQEQARRFPLKSGDAAWVGVHRIHALVHPGLSMLLVTDGTPACQAALALGSALGQETQARITVLGVGMSEERLRGWLDQVQQPLEPRSPPRLRAGLDDPGDAIAAEAERDRYDLLVMRRDEDSADSEAIEHVLGLGEYHLLLVSRPAPLPKHALLALAGGEPSKEDIFFAGRLMRHLGARVTLLSAIDDEATNPEARGRAERFLQAGVRSLGLLGVPTETIIREEQIGEALAAEMASGKYDLLVLGAPLRRLSASRIRRFLTGAHDYPVLVVRSPYAAVTLQRFASGTTTSMIEEVL